LEEGDSERGKKMVSENRRKEKEEEIDSLLEVVFLAILIEKAFEICLSDLREKREEKRGI